METSDISKPKDRYPWHLQLRPTNGASKEAEGATTTPTRFSPSDGCLQVSWQSRLRDMSLSARKGFHLQPIGIKRARCNWPRCLSTMVAPKKICTGQQRCPAIEEAFFCQLCWPHSSRASRGSGFITRTLHHDMRGVAIVELTRNCIATPLVEVPMPPLS